MSGARATSTGAGRQSQSVNRGQRQAVRHPARGVALGAEAGPPARSASGHAGKQRLARRARDRRWIAVSIRLPALMEVHPPDAASAARATASAPCSGSPNQCRKGARKCGSIGKLPGRGLHPAGAARPASSPRPWLRMSFQPPTCSMTELEWTRSIEPSGTVRAGRPRVADPAKVKSSGGTARRQRRARAPPRW